MNFLPHSGRVGLLMLVAAALLASLSARTEVLIADGLRYIRQAQVIDRGDLQRGLLQSVDHPMYPLSIAMAHRLIGGTGPAAWQSAAQAASVLAAILLVIPTYLVALELFGARCAWLGSLLVFVTPGNAHVFADALSESTFLLFWMWGLWAALRFLKRGTFGWLPLMIAFSGLAYLTRPEGMLLPVAVVASLGLMPLLSATRLNWPRWWAAVGFLLIGPALLIGPFVATKGGLGTKPAVARLLGTEAKAPVDAVERSRPLDVEQSAAETYAEAGRQVIRALRDEVTTPLVPLILLGIATTFSFRDKARTWLFIGLIFAASLAALMRLHATAGYCTSRHTMILGLVLIPAAAAGLDRLMGRIRIPARWIGQEEGMLRPGPALWVVAVAGYLVWAGPALTAPLNPAFAGYRDAGGWLAEHVPADSRVVDVTGWSLFYGDRQGYTFANLIYAPGDPGVRYVVARESHLRGPWGYCDRLREMVAGLEPVASFPPDHRPGRARVLVFDRLAAAANPIIATEAGDLQRK